MYRSLDGYGQSSMREGGRASVPDLTSNHGSFPKILNRASQIQGGQQQYSATLSIFSAIIITLIAYTMLKMLTARLSNHQSVKPGKRKENSHYCTSGSKLSLGRVRARQSREERARQLILRHGGKSVTAAIRVLANELEGQKRTLNDSPPDDLACDCVCHRVESASQSH